MNFTTHALEFFRTLPRLLQQDKPIADEIIADMAAAEKFVLPFDGETGLKLDQTIVPMLRLPYPLLTFEYTCQDKSRDDNIISTKRIALLKQEGNEVTVRVMYEARGIWCLVPIFARLDFNTLRIEDKNGVPAVYADVAVLLPNLFEACMLKEKMTEPQLVNVFVDDLKEEIINSVKAIACLNARNVSVVSLPSPAKLNKKRRQNGKVEFFEYKTLSIFLGDNVLSAKASDRNRLAQHLAFKGTLKLHKCRGHFKNRNGKLFWWNFHLRGLKSNGVVDKQYKLENKNANC